MTTDWPRDPCPECERDRCMNRLKPWCDHGSPAEANTYRRRQVTRECQCPECRAARQTLNRHAAQQPAPTGDRA